jgi:hypothetical protein
MAAADREVVYSPNNFSSSPARTLTGDQVLALATGKTQQEIAARTSLAMCSAFERRQHYH